MSKPDLVTFRFERDGHVIEHVRLLETRIDGVEYYATVRLDGSRHGGVHIRQCRVAIQHEYQIDGQIVDRSTYDQAILALESRPLIRHGKSWKDAPVVTT